MIKRERKKKDTNLSQPAVKTEPIVKCFPAISVAALNVTRIMTGLFDYV